MSDRFDYLELDNTRLARPARRGAESERREAEPAPDAAPVASDGLPWRPSTAAQPATGWKVVEIIGGPGCGAGEFACPAGLAVDRDGNLYVADSYNHRVQWITPSGGVFVLGRRGTGPGEFLNPQAVVTIETGGFYVLEQGGCRIQRFGPDGHWQGAFGCRGKGRGELFAPMAMACGPCGALYVVDSGNNRIVKWSSDDVMIDSFPRPPAPPLARPQGIAVDRSGRIWISETQRHRIVLFDSLLRPLASHGSWGDTPGQFQEPQDLAVTPDGCVLIADSGNSRVQVLDPNGAPLQVIGPEEGLPANVGMLSAPSGIALRGDDEAYIADTGNHRVLRMARR